MGETLLIALLSLLAPVPVEEQWTRLPGMPSEAVVTYHSNEFSVPGVDMVFVGPGTWQMPYIDDVKISRIVSGSGEELPPYWEMEFMPLGYTEVATIPGPSKNPPLPPYYKTDELWVAAKWKATIVLVYRQYTRTDGWGLGGKSLYRHITDQSKGKISYVLDEIR